MILLNDESSCNLTWIPLRFRHPNPMHLTEESPSRTRPQLLEGEDLPPLPQQERSRLKRDALLNAGLELFAERGFEATTVEEVARRAGVAVGGFYQYFRSKRQLLLVLMDRLVEEISRIELELAFPPGVPPRLVLEFLVQRSLSIDWAYVGVHRAWDEVVGQDASLAELNRRIEDWTAELALVVTHAITRLPGARGSLDLPTLSWLVTLLFWKVAARMSSAEPGADRERVIQATTHLLYHALFCDPGS